MTSTVVALLLDILDINIVYFISINIFITKHWMKVLAMCALLDINCHNNKKDWLTIRSDPNCFVFAYLYVKYIQSVSQRTTVVDFTKSQL